MGMLYYDCVKCGGSCGIQAQFIGGVLCENCKKTMQEKSKGVPRFQHWQFVCSDCSFNVSFEAISCFSVYCVKDSKLMQQLVPAIKAKKTRNKVA